MGVKEVTEAITAGGALIRQHSLWRMLLVTYAEELQFGAFSARLTRGTRLKTDLGPATPVLLHDTAGFSVQKPSTIFSVQAFFVGSCTGRGRNPGITRAVPLLFAGRMAAMQTPRPKPQLWKVLGQQSQEKPPAEGMENCAAGFSLDVWTESGSRAIASCGVLRVTVVL